MTLQQAVFAGLVDPADLVIVRQIDDPTPAPGHGRHRGVLRRAGQLRLHHRRRHDLALRPTSTGATTRVVHARGNGADGTDTIRNIERLQFADVVAADRADHGDRGGRGQRRRPSPGRAPAGTVDGLRRSRSPTEEPGSDSLS